MVAQISHDPPRRRESKLAYEQPGCCTNFLQQSCPEIGYTCLQFLRWNGKSRYTVVKALDGFLRRAVTDRHYAGRGDEIPQGLFVGVWNNQPLPLRFVPNGDYCVLPGRCLVQRVHNQAKSCQVREAPTKQVAAPNQRGKCEELFFKLRASCGERQLVSAKDSKKEALGPG